MTTPRLRTFVTTTAIVLAGALAAPACGGSDSSAGAGDESNQASPFCVAVTALTSNPPADNATALAEAFGNLQAVAPEGNVRNAVGTVISGFEKAAAEQQKLSVLLSDPGFVAAAGTLVNYSASECGVTLNLGDNGSGGDTSPDGTDAPAPLDLPDGGAIGQAVDAYLAANAPSYRIAKVLVSDDKTHARIELSLTGSGSLNAAAVCTVIDGVVASDTPSTPHSVAIDNGGTVLAGHEPGQTC